jgi:hypothetical protein
MALALMLGASATCGAASKSASFRVVVDLLADAKTAECGVAGQQVVSVTCNQVGVQSTKPAFQTSLYLFRTNEWLGTVDAMMTTGTVTSWRVVRVSDRDYIEIVVGW